MFALNGNKPIWVRDNEHGFLLGRITDIGSETITVQLIEQKKVSRPLENQPIESLRFVFIRSRRSQRSTIRSFKRKNTKKMSMIIVTFTKENRFQLNALLLLLSGALMYLNEGTLLNNLRRRYKRDLIYVRSRRRRAARHSRFLSI